MNQNTRKTLGTKVNAAVNHAFREIMYVEGRTESDLLREILLHLIYNSKQPRFLHGHDKGRPVGIQKFTLGTKVDVKTFNEIKALATYYKVSSSTLIRWAISQRLIGNLPKKVEKGRIASLKRAIPDLSKAAIQNLRNEPEFKQKQSPIGNRFVASPIKLLMIGEHREELNLIFRLSHQISQLIRYLSKNE